MATHSSVLAWRIPGTGKPGGLPSMGSHTQDGSELAPCWAQVVSAGWARGGGERRGRVRQQVGGQACPGPSEQELVDSSALEGCGGRCPENAPGPAPQDLGKEERKADARDGEAWWAAIYGVAQSQTRLK